MLCIIYIALTAFELTAAIAMMKKHRFAVLRPLISGFLNGTGIALIALSIIFQEAFMAFDDIFSNSVFMPILMFASVIALLLFFAAAKKCKE